MIARKNLAAFGIAAAIAATAGILPSATPSAHAYTYNYGAISYSYSGRVSYAVDYPSAGAAANAAKARCGGDCGYFTFFNSCGAVAYQFGYGQTRVGRAHGYPTRAGAERAARAEAGWGSQVRGWACTTRPR